jgi:ribonuclease Y
VARLTLERLISDGRIHPARIEETVEKCRREVEAVVKQAGERATYEVGIPNLHPDLVKLLGRLRYRTSYGQNVLKHSIEVAFLAGIMAEELGVDAATAKRAGLLHDIGKAFPHDVEGTHVELGVNVCRKYKENKDVVHAIEAHHNDVEPQTIIAILVQAADAISASRPGARREDLENYIKRLEKLEEIAKGFEGVEKAFAIQAGRELRVMVKPEDVNDEGMKLIAREMAKKIQDEVKYPGQIKVNVIRESRAVDYAK